MLPSGTAISSATQLFDYVEGIDLPIEIQTPLLVRDQRMLWRENLPFTLTDGTKLEASIDLYYPTFSSAMDAEQLGTKPMKSSEFSFKVCSVCRCVSVALLLVINQPA
jgi:hypothetical protein